MDQLIRRYVDFVYAVALRLMRDPHAAADVTQAVFIVFTRKLHSIHSNAIAAWLHQTTRYTASNARRLANIRARHERAAATLHSEIAMNRDNQMKSQFYCPCSTKRSAGSARRIRPSLSTATFAADR